MVLPPAAPLLLASSGAALPPPLLPLPSLLLASSLLPAPLFEACRRQGPEDAVAQGAKPDEGRLKK